MAFAELPPQLPEPGTLSSLRTQSERGVIAMRGYQIHMLGTAALDIESLRALVSDAPTQSAAVRIIARAHYDAGRPGTKLIYALDGTDLYVLVIEPPVIGVRAPDALLPFFSGLDSSRTRAFEPRRLLANAYSERARIRAQPSLRPTEGGWLLDIEAGQSPPKAPSFGAELSNPGNRYVGRYFADIDARYHDRRGNAYGGELRTGIKALEDDEAGADRYHEISASVSRVTPFGIVDLQLESRNYRRSAYARREGKLREGQLGLLFPLAATLHSRWVAEAQLQYTDNHEVLQTPRPLLDDEVTTLNERFPALQLALHYAADGESDWTYGGGLSIHHGLGHDKAASDSELDYLALTPSFDLQRSIGARASASLTVSGQYSDDRLPTTMQWVLGGSDKLAAYLPGVALGDSGWVAVADLQYKVPVPRGLRLYPRLFIEHGGAQLQDGGTVMLADLGAELAFRWQPHVKTTLTGALPLATDNIDARTRRDARAKLLFSIRAQF